jgi:DNA polymerase III delta subunit
MLIFRFIDFLAEGKTVRALAYIEELLRRGHDPQSLWNIFLWMLRNLVTVAIALQDGQRNLSAIAKAAKIPPMTCRALMPLARKVSLRSLHALIAEVLDADMNLKTGMQRSSGEEPEELLALLDRFVLRTGELVGSKALP